MIAIKIDETVTHKGTFTFRVVEAHTDDLGRVVSAEIETPSIDDDGWDPSKGVDGYPDRAILDAIRDATGRACDLHDGFAEGDTETWHLKDLGPAVPVSEGWHALPGLPDVEVLIQDFLPVRVCHVFDDADTAERIDSDDLAESVEALTGRSVTVGEWEAAGDVRHDGRGEEVAALRAV